MGIFSIFGTSLRALSSYSTAMGVLSNNIANSSNEHYSRQRVEFSAMSPDRTGNVETGRGLTLQSVTQVVNNATEIRINDAIQEFGKNDTTSTYLRSVENVMNEAATDGLNTKISAFFNSFTALASEPESTTVRQNALNAAQDMVDMFHSYGDQLASFRTSTDQEIKTLLPQINSKLQEIGDINAKIRDSTVDPLTFKDTRRQLINELSDMIDVNVIDDGSDEIKLYTKDGLPLVSGLSVASFDVDVDVTNDNHYSIQYSMGGSTADVTDRIQSGQLKGLLDVRDTYLNSYQDKLDDLAYTVSTEINTLHAAGYDLDGITGNNFFQDLGGVTSDAARNLQLDAAVDGNPRSIALSANVNEIPGGNDVANSIADLADSVSITFQDGSINSFGGYFSDFLAGVGNDAKIGDNASTFYDNVLAQAKIDRSQESGVNIDEEEVEMLKLQAAYQAAGRMMKVADSILQSLFEALQ